MITEQIAFVSLKLLLELFRAFADLMQSRVSTLIG